ncbi:MAG: methyltransferase domain-containing protein [Azospirillum sp.]|nr:methyltransferase domain-containing protein [Azospirillum sp.]
MSHIDLPIDAIDAREGVREQRFGRIWKQDLNAVFADVARYYDRANHVASLGLWNWFLRRFMAVVEVKPGQRVLDVCAGTNAIGIALLKREPGLDVHAIDRSAEMLEVGEQNARTLGFAIDCRVGDVHVLPYPDNHFDLVTLQFATRHLRVKEVFAEIRRVLKPGGHFYHSDMLRPSNRVVEAVYFGFLRFTLAFTSLVFRSSPEAKRCRRYFVDALELFYSADEFSAVLREFGFVEVRQSSLLFGVLGFHRGVEPEHGG